MGGTFAAMLCLHKHYCYTHGSLDAWMGIHVWHGGENWHGSSATMIIIMVIYFRQFIHMLWFFLILAVEAKQTPNALVEKEYPIILSIGIKWNIIFYVFLQSSVFLMNTSVSRLIASLVLSVTIFWKSRRVFPRKQLQQLREVHSMRPGRGRTVCLIDGNMKMPLWIESIYVIIPLKQNMFNDTKWPF